LVLELSCNSIDVEVSFAVTFEVASKAAGASDETTLAKDLRKLAGSPVKPHLGQQPGGGGGGGSGIEGGG